eukprot:9044302-Pyramimonas_sp.AAC.1
MPGRLLRAGRRARRFLLPSLRASRAPACSTAVCSSPPSQRRRRSWWRSWRRRAAPGSCHPASRRNP